MKRFGYDAFVKEYQSRLNDQQEEPESAYSSLENRLFRLRRWFFAGLTALEFLKSESIHSKYLKIDDYGRVHSNLTGSPRIIRPYLSFEGCDEPMAMVDLSNAQPFLLVNLIMEWASVESGKNIDTRTKLAKFCQKNNYTDIMKYVAIVENGDFYKECYRLFRGKEHLKEISPEKKEDMREMIYVSLFYGDGNTKWIEAQELLEKFQDAYPNVTTIIQYYRTPDYKGLSKRLQREESKLFISDILTKLVVRDGRRYILSLHDGIFCPISQVEAVIGLLNHSFSKSQLRPSVKIEYLDTGKSEKRRINL